MRAGQPFAVDDENSGNGASANAGPFVFPMVFNGSAVELTPLPGAPPRHGQGTVTVCAPRNADFASFYKVFEGILETVCGSGKPCAGGSSEMLDFALFYNVF